MSRLGPSPIDAQGLPELVVVGRIAGLYGVRGWVKVFSHTSPRENIVGYGPWYLRLDGEWRPMRVAAGKIHGKGVIARLEGIEERDGAARLVGADIAVPRERLPAADDDEYYWSDLEGMQVVTLDGTALGEVDHLFETGANDVMVVRGERERLLPFIGQVVIEVDPAARQIRVDWDPEF